MEFRTFLCFLCVGCALAARLTENDRVSTTVESTDYKNGTESPTARKSSDNETGVSHLEIEKDRKDEPELDENGKPRDKRTLGMILTGLAGILGYTVSPVQVASLPNPRAAPAPPPPQPPPIPNQKETIRLTGVVNVGDSADLLGHLQRYEQVFHGSAAAPAAAGVASQSGTNVQVKPKPPIGPPVFAKIPSPIAPNLPPPLLPAPAPRPTQPLPLHPQSILNDYKGSDDAEKYRVENYPSDAAVYPPKSSSSGGRYENEKEYRNNENVEKYEVEKKPITSTKQFGPDGQIEKEYRKSENVERYKVENNPINSEKEVTVPESQFRHQLYVDEPDWKKNHEDRLSSLEKKEEERVERLQEQEEERGQPREYSDYEEIDNRYRNREKEIDDRDSAIASRLEAREEADERDAPVEREQNQKEDAREEDNDEDSPAFEEYSKPRQYDDYEEASAENKGRDDDSHSRYRDDDDDGDESTSRSGEQEDDKLPIAGNYEKPPSEPIRNSYGEIIENDEKDENVADYFARYKNPDTGLYDSERVQRYQESETANKEEPWWKGNDGGSDFNYEKIRQEYSAPESKYEEYDVDDTPEKSESGTSARLEDLGEKVEPTSKTNESDDDRDEPRTKRVDREDRREVLTTPATPRKDEERPRTRERLRKEDEDESIPFHEFDFSNYSPYLTPIRIIYGQDELKSSTGKILASYENSDKRDDEDSRRPEEVREGESDEEEEEEEAEEEEPKSSNIEEDLRPTIGLPEKLTAKSLHDEGESKDYQIWPAPFDYVFDSTEQTNVVQAENIPEAPGGVHPTAREESSEERRSSRSEESSEEKDVAQSRKDQSIVPDKPSSEPRKSQDSTDYRNYRGTANEDYPTPRNYETESRTASPHASKDKFHSTPEPGRDGKESRGPSASEEQRHPPKDEELDPRNDFLARYRYGFEDPNPDRDEPSPAIQLQGYEPREPKETHRKYQSSESQQKKIAEPNAREHGGGDHEKYGSSGEETPEIHHYYTDVQPHLSGRRFDENADAPSRPEDIGAAQPTSPTSPAAEKQKAPKKFEDPKSAHDFFGFSKDDYSLEGDPPSAAAENSKAETPGTAPTATEAELGLLTVPEPIPYYIDETLTEFTDDPASDTEKVKVKEYRNKIATVKVSELKQLSPNGPVTLIGYTKNF